MAVRIHQERNGNTRNVLIRRRGITTVAGKYGKDPEQRGEVDQSQVVVRKVTRVEIHVRDTRNRGQHLFDQPKLARLQGEMVGTGEPLAESHDGFELCFGGGGNKGSCTLDRIWV